MPRCGGPARRAVSKRARAHEKNPALSVDRTNLGTSKRASYPARLVPAVAPHGPRCSADACRGAIGRPILQWFSSVGQRQLHGLIAPLALVVDVHPLLALPRRLDHRAVGVEDGLLEEAGGLLLPDLDTGVVEDFLQGGDTLDVEPAAEVAGCRRFRNPADTEGIEVGLVVPQ